MKWLTSSKKIGWRGSLFVCGNAISMKCSFRRVLNLGKFVAIAMDEFLYH